MSSMTNHKFSLQGQLFDIFNNFPSIFMHEQVSICSRIYYPIAVIDALVEENVRQPFSPLEQIVIELVKSGHNSIELISNCIGLPHVFVEDVVRRLEEDGLMHQFVLTSKGEYGVKQKIKFTSHVYKQTIQYDALLHEVLLENPIDDTYLVPMQSTNNAISHFLPHSHLDLNKIKQTFDVSFDGKDNVVAKNIKEILNVKVYFVEAIALLFNLIPHPFIFFPNEYGNYTKLITISEANLTYYNDNMDNKLTIDRKRYYELWLSVKQIKDEMKKTQDNHILRRDIKAKVRQYIEFCNEEHTLLTDAGISLVLQFDHPFVFNLNNFNAIKSLEWTSRHIPYLIFENDIEYSSFIAYSECFDRRVHDISKLIFQLEQMFGERDKLYLIIGSLMSKQGINQLTVSELHVILSQIHSEQIRLRKSM